MTVRAGTAYRKIWRLDNNFFCSHNKFDCSEIPIVLSNLLYHYFFHWIMAHFNFVISQNVKWGHAGFYIDRHRMTSSKYAYRKVLFYKKSTGTSYCVSVLITDAYMPSTCSVWEQSKTWSKWSIKFALSDHVIPHLVDVAAYQIVIIAVRANWKLLSLLISKIIFTMLYLFT